MKRIGINNWLWLVFFILLACFFLKNSFGYLNPDLGWHLKMGEEIFLTHKLPQIETHDFSLEGQIWADHEWLSNLITFLIYSKCGYVAVGLFFMVVALLAFYVISRLVKKFFKNNDFILLLFLFFGAIGIHYFLGVRMQEITILNFALLIYLLFHYEKYGDYRVLFFLPPLLYFWACAHAGFLISIFVLCFWIFVKIIELFLSKKFPFSFLSFPPNLSGKKIAVLSVFSAAALAVTFATPYKLAIYEFLIKTYSNTYFMSHIAEWLPVYYLPLSISQITYFAVACVIYVLWLLFAVANKKDNSGSRYRISVWFLLSMPVFMAMAIKARRNFPLFFIISLPFVVEFLTTYIDFGENFLDKAFGKFKKVFYIFVLVGLLTLAASELNTTNFSSHPFSNYCATYPCGAAKFLKEHPEYDSLRLFNNYDWGGFLLWVMPEKQIFIDGRFPPYPINGHSMMEEYKEFFEVEKTAQKLDQYNIGMVLLKKEKAPQIKKWEKFLFLINSDKVSKEENFLQEHLELDKSWLVVYEDEISKIYIKNSTKK